MVKKQYENPLQPHEYPKIIVSDEDDEHPSAVTFEEALEQNLVRRAVKVFLINENGEVYLQERSPGVALYPGRLDSSAGGHVQEGSDPEKTAHAEIFEELGIKDAHIVFAGKQFVDIEGENPMRAWEYVYLVEHAGGDIEREVWEIEGGAWVPIQDVIEMIEDSPEQFSPSCVAAFSVLVENYDLAHCRIHSNVIATDDEDKNPQYVRFTEAEAQGLNRRTTAIMVVHNGRALLQHRSYDMRVSPGQLDFSAGGHVDEGETYDECAVRELKEELGLEGGTLVRLGKEHIVSKTEGYRIWATYYIYDAPEGAETPDDREVYRTAWKSFDEIDELIEMDHADLITPSLKQLWPRIKENYDRKAMQIYPDITVVDEHDENPRPERFINAIREGLIRRTVGVMVVNSGEQKVLFPKRSMDLMIEPGKLGISAGGQVDFGETCDEAARRELHEELGIKTSELRKLKKHYREYKARTGDTIRAFGTVYVYEHDGGDINFDTHEVTELVWLTPTEIDEKLEHENVFSSGFKKIWDEIRDIIFT